MAFLSVTGKLNPMNIRMSDAMTTAAAVIAPAEDVSKNPGRDLQIMLGLAARNHIRSDPNEDYKCECPGVKVQKHYWLFLIIWRRPLMKHLSRRDRVSEWVLFPRDPQCSPRWSRVKPKGNSEFYFPGTLNVPRGEAEVLYLPTQNKTIHGCQLTTLLQNVTNPSNLHIN